MSRGDAADGDAAVDAAADGDAAVDADADSDADLVDADADAAVEGRDGRTDERARATDPGTDAGADAAADGAAAATAAGAVADGEAGADPDPDPDADANASTDADATDGPVARLRRTTPTNRWAGVDGLALLAGGLGALTRQPALLLVGVVGVAFAAYARSGGPAAPDLRVERELSDATPEPGDEVRVTVRVHNAGGAVADLRLLDGVPPGLGAVEGDVARHATALRPGRRATFSYRVRAARGEHAFEPVTAIVRDAPGATERTYDLEPASPTVLRCLPRLEGTATLPLRGLTTGYAGRVATDVPGPGVEFHATRDYRPGDPRARVDWNRLARTGELATTEFREERAASVLLLVDAREAAYRAPDDESRHAVDRAVDAAGAAVPALLDAGDRVGIAALSGAEAWLAPGTGSAHRARARELLATHPAFAATPSEERFFRPIALRRLRRRLAPHVQVVCLSPVVDDPIVDVIRRLDAYGHAVTVLSPDPTTDATPGGLLARVERRTRLRRLREAGVRVVDWGDEPLATALDRAGRGGGGGDG